MHKKLNNHGYTLSEIIVVVIILGALTSLAVPQYRVSIEKARAAEGIQILTATVSAQKRFALENNTYTNQFNQLDITLPATQNFNLPTAFNVAINSNEVIASIQRRNPAPFGNYTLSITEQTGTITCAGGTGTICNQIL